MMLSPFVTNVLIGITHLEAESYYQLRDIAAKTENEEQKTAIASQAAVHYAQAQFFSKLARERVEQHDKGVS